ncbi:hypothetical protein HYH03_017292 [Edaphochlamys debaryana]|uniref:Helicase-associated domain-containing protein n=1 Tax=Edaphochlamys debaryana TaxID=47281 RepID=A0A836BQS3_9CHLO|nr:hypothetical protein HYH03_017292 [Edaphochlamys debaryana]|eukprot:KAG2483898.1 hypothetical protein HYH03_017292 [Edaphochlamys debaryana]
MQQREGRVGRVGPGTVYHLFSEMHRKAQPGYPQPRLLQMDITQELLAMLMHGDVANLITSCEELITPPTVAQVTCALALMHFYRMIDAYAPGAADKKLHFNDIHWHQVDRFGSLADLKSAINGRLTPLGSLVFGVVAGARLSPWAALMYVMGAINGVDESAFALACVVDMQAPDPSVLLPVSSRSDSKRNAGTSSHRSVDPALQVVGAYGASDHAALLNIYKLAASATTNGVDLYRATGMSSAFWDRVVNKVTDGRSADTRALTMRIARGDALLADESLSVWRDAFARIDVAQEGYSAVHHDILKVVLLSRLYHFTKPDVAHKGAYSFVFDVQDSRKMNHDQGSASPGRLKFQSPVAPGTLMPSGVVEALVDAGQGQLTSHLSTAFVWRADIAI